MRVRSIGGSGGILGGGDSEEFRNPFVEGDDRSVGDFGESSMDEDEVALDEGVLDSALGALGDDV